MLIEIGHIESPLAPITFALRDGRVCALSFADHWARQEAALRRRFPAATFGLTPDSGDVGGRLAAYFAGSIETLDAIEVDAGGTPFQQRVWRALRDVRAGRTASYREIARAIGAPSAVRAVGAANGANPISIIVPCHRIIGAAGGLVGYGGGLERKRWLLRHEGIECPDPGPRSTTRERSQTDRGIPTLF